MSGARVELLLSKDRLQAELVITSGEAAGVDLIRAVLREAGVTDGIDEEVLAELGEKLADPDFRSPAVGVAQGDPGAAGRDGELQLRMVPAQLAGSERLDGSIDLRERCVVVNIGDGECLGSYSGPTPGEEGRTVTGEPIHQPDGKQGLPKWGKGVRFDEETGQVFAAQSGILCYVESTLLDVMACYKNDGDVDYESGNLHVDGAVLVGGNIEPGFSVTATGDVIVQGSHCAGNILSETNIALKGGILSESGKDRVEAEGSITCRHANGAILRSGATLEISDHCVNSSLAARYIRLDRGRGKLVGGETHAQESICVVEVGSPTAAPTLLSVADMFVEKEQLDAFADKAERKARRRELERQERKLLETAQIRIAGTAHSGVQIRFGTARLLVVDSVQAPRFTYDPETDSVRMETPQD